MSMCCRRARAFTLIELLVVITIIVTLAGLTIGIMGTVNRQSSMNRARAEIAQLEAAMEAYRADYGTFPGANATTGIPELSPNPDALAYKTASRIVYQSLCIKSTNYNPLGKIYLQPRPGQLADTNNLLQTYLRDPFGYAYGFNTTNSTTVNPNAGGTNLQVAVGVSIWSTTGNTAGTATNKWLTNYDDRRR